MRWFILILYGFLTLASLASFIQSKDKEKITSEFLGIIIFIIPVFYILGEMIWSLKT